MSALVPYADLDRMAEALAKSKLFGMKTKEEAIALMLVAQAEGKHPGTVANEYHIIQGRPALKTDAMLARFQAAGGKVKYLQLSDECVEAEFSHPQGGSAVIKWDKPTATKAGLWGKDNWNKYPRAMLRARVVSEGVRTVFPGVAVGLYTPEEVQDFDDKPAPMRDVTPPKPMPKLDQPVNDVSPEPGKPLGIWQIKLPGGMGLFHHTDDPAEFVAEYNKLCNQVAGSKKIKENEREQKIADLKDENGYMLEQLFEAHPDIYRELKYV